MAGRPKWTKEQREVIEYRGSDLLVSAAAGSGKTAVLVERILRRITDDQTPIDIDRILVVTFTRAAAREMKDRIGKAIENRLNDKPNDMHLIRQTALLANAMITTIDSFCINLIHNYFDSIDISPDIRIADEGEITLLSAEVWNDILEEEYERADADFIALTEQFAKRDRDESLIATLMTVYNKALSFPYPDEWLLELSEKYGNYSGGDFEADWLNEFVDFIKKEYYELSLQAALIYDEAVAFTGGADCCDVIANDRDYYESCANAADYRDLYSIVSGYTFTRWNSKGISEDMKEIWSECKDKRDKLKKAETKIRGKAFVTPPDMIQRSLEAPRAAVTEIVRLVKLFLERFAEAKQKEGIMDFSDAEHFALNILFDENTKEKRSAAYELSEYFEEVMIDEYQDSNALQEAILSGIARRDDGRRNYFMVGDVKQSIYRFRQADPMIFVEKQRLFESGNDKLITLDKNFRSRDCVIDVVNEVFFDIMHSDIGGVEYDDDASLKRGNMTYEKNDDSPVELMLGVKDDPAFMAEHMNSDDIQAAMIARIIEDVMKSTRITCDDGTMRRVTYRDIAVLGQTNSKNAVLSEKLSHYGIPAVTNQTFGFFDTTEIRTVTALLAVINNPIDDISMAAVLHSPIVGLDNETMAKIRKAHPDGRYIDAVKEYAASDKRISEFLEMLEEFRDLSKAVSIHELLPAIYERTGYFEYVSAMPGGKLRVANLEKLNDMAISFSDGRYSDLYRFIDHVKKQREYEIEHAGASEFSEGMDAVSIMTVHKSKGLEYPVVILSDIQKQLERRGNKNDSHIVIHPKMGIGMPTLDGKRRIRRKNLHQAAITHFAAVDDRAERMRLLYVAMTRAREKLIICGTVSMDEANEIRDGFLNHKSYALSYVERLEATRYLDLMLPTFFGSANVRFTVFDAASAIKSDVETTVDAGISNVDDRIKQLLALPDEATSLCALNDSLNYSYPFSDVKEYKNKYSVSEIKHAAIESNLAETIADSEGEGDIYAAEQIIPEFIKEERKRKVPRFARVVSEDARPDDTYTGALRGTAMHRFLECFDFSRENAYDTFYEQIEEQLESGLLKQDQRELLSDARLRDFLTSDLARRMMASAKAGRLYKERAFVMGDRPSVFFGDSGENASDVDVADDDAFVLVQGIIDVFFVEDDGIVLLDYKTDRVKTATELQERYKKQIDLYADAIERSFSLTVKERLLYSFSLGEVVEV